MAWPPPVLPTNRTNATPQLDTHAADHNAYALAMNDVVGHAGAQDAQIAVLNQRGAFWTNTRYSQDDTGPGVWGTVTSFTAGGVSAGAIQIYSESMLLCSTEAHAYIKIDVNGVLASQITHTVGARYSNVVTGTLWTIPAGNLSVTVAAKTDNQILSLLRGVMYAIYLRP